MMAGCTAKLRTKKARFLIPLVRGWTGEQALLSDPEFVTILVADVIQVLVPAAAHIDEDGGVFGPGGR